jgi:hypothetical protein
LEIKFHSLNGKPVPSIIYPSSIESLLFFNKYSIISCSYLLPCDVNIKFTTKLSGYNRPKLSPIEKDFVGNKTITPRWFKCREKLVRLNNLNSCISHYHPSCRTYAASRRSSFTLHGCVYLENIGRQGILVSY